MKKMVVRAYMQSFERYASNGQMIWCLVKEFAASHSTCYRSSHRWCSVIKGVHGNFTKFTEKHLCQSLFFNKVLFIKKEPLAQVFSYEFYQISKNASGRLLLVLDDLWFRFLLILLKSKNAWKRLSHSNNPPKGQSSWNVVVIDRNRDFDQISILQSVQV